MADLASVLTDPNFVNANAATKQAIFEKYAPQDTNFSNANEATQQAIRAKFGVTPIVKAPEITAKSPPIQGSALGGVLETGANMITGTLGSALGGLRGLGSLAMGEGSAEATRKIRATQNALTYEPRTKQGQQMVTALGLPMEAASYMTGELGNLVGGERGRAVGEIIPAVAATLTGGGALLRRARTAGTAAEAAQTEKNINESWQNAGRIEAAQTANNLGINLNPAVSNPTLPNKIKTALTGNIDINAKLAKSNEPKWTEIAKEDMGLPVKSVLDEKAFAFAKEKASAPYRVIEKLPALTSDTAVIDNINKLRVDELMDTKAASKAVNKLINIAVNTINSGLTGDLALKNIRQLRTTAQDIYKSDKITPIERSTADAKMGIANQLENLIEANITDPNLLTEFRAARTKNAQIFNYERATNFATKQLDPTKLAKLAEEGQPLSGKLRDMAIVAANFPDIAGVGPKSLAQKATEFGATRLSRSGPGGTLGYVAGSMMGFPGIPSAIIGAGLGEGIGLLQGRRMLNPKYQSKNAVPTDYRSINNLAQSATNAENQNSLNTYSMKP